MKTLAFVSSLSVLVFVAEAQWRRIGTNSLEASLVYEGVNSQVQDRLVMNELWEAYKRRDITYPRTLRGTNYRIVFNADPVANTETSLQLLCEAHLNIMKRPPLLWFLKCRRLFPVSFD